MSKLVKQTLTVTSYFIIIMNSAKMPITSSLPGESCKAQFNYVLLDGGFQDLSLQVQSFCYLWCLLVISSIGYVGMQLFIFPSLSLLDCEMLETKNLFYNLKNYFSTIWYMTYSFINKRMDESDN